jgi:hypothetical protein
MRTFYNNQKLAYKCIDREIGKQFHNLQQKIKYDKLLRNSVEIGSVDLPAVVNADLFSMERAKLKAQMSPAYRNEKIQ